MFIVSFYWNLSDLLIVFIIAAECIPSSFATARLCEFFFQYLTMISFNIIINDKIIWNHNLQQFSSAYIILYVILIVFKVEHSIREELKDTSSTLRSKSREKTNFDKIYPNRYSRRDPKLKAGAYIVDKVRWILRLQTNSQKIASNSI